MKKILKKVIAFFLSVMLLTGFIEALQLETVDAAVALKSTTIRNYVLGKVGQSYPNGYCLKFVEECYQNLGASRPYSCCASKSGSLFIRSTSSSDIPVGSTVYFGNCGGGPCRSCASSYYGHVGIYVGDGYFVHATGGKVQKSTISSWASKYRGYGYCGNFNLDVDYPAKDNFSTDYAGNYIVTTSTYPLTMRSGPSSGYSVVTTIPRNATVYVEKANGSWAYVSYGGYRGYCSMEYLQKVEQETALPDTVLTAWLSKSAMGENANNIKINDLIYICYRLETKDGNLLDPSIGNYSVKETIYFPDGSSPSYSYERSNNNWVRASFNQWGTYRGVVEISGDYTGSVQVSFTLSKESCEHEFGAWITTKKETCTENGIEKRTCSLCGATETHEIKAVGHKYTTKVIAPTTSQKGYTLHICTVCGYSYKSDYTECKKQLSYIIVTVKPNKTEYYLSEKIDTAGMKVIAGYSDKTEREVTGWTISGDTSKEGNTWVIVKYTENGKTVSTYFRIAVKKKEDDKITITYDSCGGDLGVKDRGGIKGVTTSVWSEIPKKNYQMTLDPNGGTVSNKKISINAPFIAWYSSPGAKGTQYKAGQTVSFKNSMTLYAAYGKASVGNLPSPSRDGYIFEGWYLSDGTKVLSDTQISDNCTLTAKWQEEVKETSHVHTPGEWVTTREATAIIPGEKVLRCQECGQIIQREQIPVLQVSDDDILTDDPEYGQDDEEESDETDVLEVGDELETDKEIYTITKLGNTPCVEYTELFDDEITDVVIPDTVAIDGVVYKVTSVASKAFYKNTEIKSVTIASDTTKIGSKAFYGCKSLKKIMILSTKLKSGSIGSKAFSNMAKNVKIYVPREKYKTYKKLLKKAGIGSKAKIYWFVFK